MTDNQQRRFYFPAWNGCAVANGWVMVKGRLRADIGNLKPEVQSWPEPAREMGLKVLVTAEQVASQQHRAVVADDLRHACNYVAAGKLSSGDLDNKQTNRVVALFNLLADPEDLDAVMNWLHPENAERGSFVSFLRRKAHEATLRAISNEAFQTKNWEELPIEKLRWLAKELKNREPRPQKTFHRQPATVEAGVSDSDPF